MKKYSISFGSEAPKEVSTIPTPRPSGLMNIKGVFDKEVETEIENRLRGGLYKVEFRKMALTDPTCGAVLLALTKAFQGITWKCMDDEQGILAESLENVNWIERLEDILTEFIYGYSVMETTIKETSPGRYVWGSMYYRPQTTISDWIFTPDGKLQTIKQQGLKGDVVDIPARKCLVFNTTKTQTTPEGKSLFRNAYRSWYYKTNFEKVEAIGIERDLTGLPVLGAPDGVELQNADGSLNKLGEWAWNTVRNIKRNSQEGLVKPPGWTFELVGSPGKRQFDLNAVVGRYSSDIALSMLSQFLILGISNSSGSFALATAQKDLFNVAVEGFAVSLANAVNTQFIGSPVLKTLNGLEKKPYLMPVGISKPNISDLASFLGRLLKFNIITPDEKLEEHLRNVAGLPSRDRGTEYKGAISE